MYLNNNTLPRHFLLFNNSARKLILLDQISYKIGRSLLNEIVIEGNPISRVHARLQKVCHYTDGIAQYRIFDGISDENPSKNGVFINDLRTARHTLQNGDIISFANIIKALYIKTDLSDSDFERFQESVVSDPSILGSFLGDEIANAVDSHLSNLDYTTIMLGEPSRLSRETVSFER
jgi:pSer/pThr/pTyr-binding forkhead associated (FHA) protein